MLFFDASKRAFLMKNRNAHFSIVKAYFSYFCFYLPIFNV